MDNLTVGTHCVFDSPYEQYAERNGEKCVVTRVFDHDDEDHDYFDVGVMYEIQFDDGEKIEAWPEELTEMVA